MNPQNANEILARIETQARKECIKKTVSTKHSVELLNYLVNTIGCKLHDYRVKSGLSLRDINRPEKISMTVISDLENGKKMPKFDTLLRLMEIVEMPYTEVFNPDILPNKPSVSAVRVGLIQGSNVDNNDDLKELLLSRNFTYKEIEDIIQYMAFLKSKRK